MKRLFLLLSLFFCSFGARAAEVGWNDPQSNQYITAISPSVGGFCVGTEGEGLFLRGPGGDWQSIDAQNLGDQTVTSLLLDGKDRLWVGTSSAGVAVWNGKEWARFEGFSGPLSDRVNDLALGKNGEIWMATDAGLCVWSDERGWDYPLVFENDSTEARAATWALAIDKTGRVFAAQSDGLLIYSPQNETYKLEKIAGPRDAVQKARFLQPDSPAGSGFLGGVIHDLAFDSVGNLWCATKWGVCKSDDGGKSWFFLRGEDWTRNFYGDAGNLVAKTVKTPVDLLSEDWVTTLAPTGDGKMWIGFRQKGAELRDGTSGELLALSRDDAKIARPGGDDWIRAIWPLANDRAIFGRFPGGLAGYLGADFPANEPKLFAFAPLPQNHVPDAAQLQKLAANLAAKTGIEVGGGQFLNLDRATRGDWIGRYGNAGANLLGAFEDKYLPADFALTTEIGPHDTAPPGAVYRHTHETVTQNPNVLWLPENNKRWQAEINDGTWQDAKYPQSWDGPDLWVSFVAPAGVHRAALYWFNMDAHSGPNARRDHSVSLFKFAPGVQKTLKTLPLCTTRLSDGWNGTYANFLVRGPAVYYVRVARERSPATKLSGLFFDRLDEESPRPKWVLDKFLPAPETENADTPPEKWQSARELWQACDEAQKRGIATRNERVLAYRAAQNANAPAAILQSWRAKIGLWTSQDRAPFQPK